MAVRRTRGGYLANFLAFCENGPIVADAKYGLFKSFIAQPMSFDAIFLLTERALKIVCVVVGVLFAAISLHVWSQGALKANDAQLLILIPFLSSIVLLAGAAFLKKRALQALVLAWFVGVPAMFLAVNTYACRAGWFSASWCQ